MHGLFCRGFVPTNVHFFASSFVIGVVMLFMFMFMFMFFLHRDEMEAEDYEEQYNDTREQLKELDSSLAKMKTGNLSLLDDISSMQMVKRKICPFFYDSSISM